MEFEFKIIGVEKGTHSLTSENGDKWDVDNLPDAPNILESAPEKRVIELPVNDIDSLENAKIDATDVSDFIDMLFGTEYEEPRFPLSTMIEVNIIADWYLHPKLVEFVPKKEPKFYVEVDRGNDFRYVSFTTNEMVYPVSFTYNKRLMGEIEADELVAGLTALNARKVKVDE